MSSEFPTASAAVENAREQKTNNMWSLQKWSWSRTSYTLVERYSSVASYRYDSCPVWKVTITILWATMWKAIPLAFCYQQLIRKRRLLESGKNFCQSYITTPIKTRRLQLISARTSASALRAITRKFSARMGNQSRASQTANLVDETCTLPP